MANTIDPTKIVSFANSTVPDAANLNTTFAEIVTKHDLVANEVDTDAFGAFTPYQQMMAIRAGWLG